MLEILGYLTKQIWIWNLCKLLNLGQVWGGELLFFAQNFCTEAFQTLPMRPRYSLNDSYAWLVWHTKHTTWGKQLSLDLPPHQKVSQRLGTTVISWFESINNIIATRCIQHNIDFRINQLHRRKQKSELCALLDTRIWAVTQNRAFLYSTFLNSISHYLCNSEFKMKRRWTLHSGLLHS